MAQVLCRYDLTLDQAKQARGSAGSTFCRSFGACGGDLDRVVRVLRLGGFVQGGPDFDAIPAVINGASDVMVDVFGDCGRHARSAVGVFSLPRGYAVEVDAVIDIAA